MISVIFSSRYDAEYNERMTNHIKIMSGIKPEYIEILHIENDGQHDMSTVYASAMLNAKFNIVVLLNEDAKILTERWGELLIDAFASKQVGILGVAGTLKLEDAYWAKNSEHMIGKIMRRNQTAGKEWDIYPTVFDNGEHPGRVVKVESIFGIFMAVQKDMIHKNFNTKLKGKSHWDTAFCIDNAVSGVPVGLIFDIEVLYENESYKWDDFDETLSEFTSIYEGQVNKLENLRQHD